VARKKTLKLIELESDRDWISHAMDCLGYFGMVWQSMDGIYFLLRGL
jgi:hypothetical protein